jgi:hypothetical protein
MFLVILVAVTRTVPFSAMSAFLIEVIRLAIVSLPMTNEFLGIPGLDIKGMFDLLRGICLRCNELIHVPFDELSILTKSISTYKTSGANETIFVKFNCLNS